MDPENLNDWKAGEGDEDEDMRNEGNGRRSRKMWEHIQIGLCVALLIGTILTFFISTWPKGPTNIRIGCELSNEEINRLSDAFQAATVKLKSKPGSNSNNSVRFGSPIRLENCSCKSKISHVINLADYLAKFVPLMKRVEQTDTQVYEIFRADYTEKETEFNELLEYLERENKQLFSDGNSGFPQNLAKFRQEIKSSLAENKLRGEGLVISLIKKGEYAKAVEEFSKRLDNGHLEKITRLIYYRDVESVEHILGFTNALPNCSQVNINLPTLFELIREGGELTRPFILFIPGGLNRSCVDIHCSPTHPVRLAAYIGLKQMCRFWKVSRSSATTLLDEVEEERSRYKSGYCGDILALAELEVELQDPIEKVISTWAGMIRKGEYQEIIDFANASTFTKEWFTSYIPDIVRWSYSYKDPDSFLNVLGFVDALPSMKHQAAGYHSLLKAVQEDESAPTNLELQIAAKVNRALDNVEGISEDERREFESMKREFSQTVREHFWGKGEVTALVGQSENNSNNKTEAVRNISVLC